MSFIYFKKKKVPSEQFMDFLHYEVQVFIQKAADNPSCTSCTQGYQANQNYHTQIKPC